MGKRLQLGRRADWYKRVMITLKPDTFELCIKPRLEHSPFSCSPGVLLPEVCLCRVLLFRPPLMTGRITGVLVGVAGLQGG